MGRSTLVHVVVVALHVLGGLVVVGEPWLVEPKLGADESFGIFRADSGLAVAGAGSSADVVAQVGAWVRRKSEVLRVGCVSRDRAM